MRNIFIHVFARQATVKCDPVLTARAAPDSSLDHSASTQNTSSAHAQFSNGGSFNSDLDELNKDQHFELEKTKKDCRSRRPVQQQLLLPPVRFVGTHMCPDFPFRRLK
jgi:hypothetical protein